MDSLLLIAIALGFSVQAFILLAVFLLLRDVLKKPVQLGEAGVYDPEKAVRLEYGSLEDAMNDLSLSEEDIIAGL